VSALARREAAAVRDEWLSVALSTRPADRTSTEAAIGGLYSLIGLPPPRFHWVSSPAAAMVTVPPGVRPRASETMESFAGWPLPRRFIALMNRLTLALDARVRWGHGPLAGLVRQCVRDPLARSAEASLRMPLWSTVDDGRHPRVRAWYVAQCVSRVAHYDALRRVAGVAFTARQERELDLWAAIARSGGWWWPREDVCVVSERPAAVHTEAVGDDGEVRPHRADGPAVRYADGWETYAWHGTPVPAWAVAEPSVLRIEREANIEVRRCAIERLGWETYIERAGLWPVASAPDPGNTGNELRLYDMRGDARVLLVVNGSVERDGRRRRYGLTVPRGFDDPVAAAAWTYGLSAAQYSLLARRT
jgi:hypothetical protein